jgi:protein SCO1/2
MQFKRNPVIWVVIIGAILLYSQYEGSLFGSFDSAKIRRPSLLSGADIGGPFALTDHTGRAVTDEDFRGRHMLVYFGYSYCPDICPTDLLMMTEAIAALADKAAMVQPIFVTIDPARDTVEKLAGYLPHFDERLIGLTGTEEQVASAARAYRVFYEKAPDGDSPTDYLMEHSTYIYLMGPEGEFLAHFDQSRRPEVITKTIRQFL